MKRKMIAPGRPMVTQLPSGKIREGITNAGDAVQCLTFGVRSASAIFHFLRSNRYELSSFERVLDCACGCGWTLNFLHEYVGAERLHRCDYDTEPVASPPTSFPDSHFDLIYSLAFFTHLSETTLKMWLAEWRRIVRDDGLILLSLRGPRAARCRGLSIPSRSFLHVKSASHFNEHESYQTRTHVEREWMSWFTVLDFQEGGLFNGHDLVLLGTPKSQRRQRAISPLRFPPELLQEYERRPILQFVFDENGLGRPGRGWPNLSLWDWALTNGGYDVPSLAHLSFKALYGECKVSAAGGTVKLPGTP